MVAFFKTWCESIIVAVVISIIIESILPEGNNKKYVKVVIGIYVIFTILNPFLTAFNTDFNFSKEIAIANVNTIDASNSNITAVYANGLEKVLKSKIEEEFKVKVNSLNIFYDETFENITQINLSIQDGKISKIEKVEIGNKIEKTEENNYEEIKKYIVENYNIDLEQIILIKS